MCMPKLKNKVSLITGAANGIGKATASLFAQEGAKVIMVDISKEVYDVANIINAYPLCFDVSIEKNWQKIINYITKHFSSLDIIVNNAATTGLGNNFGLQDPESMSIETWQEIHKINLNSVFLGCKYGISIMKDNKLDSSIINVASRSGIVGVPTLAAYASSKAAVRNYTKSVALYCGWKNYKIRCNAVTPAAILTRMWDHLIKNEKDQESFASKIPLKRMGEPVDVAKAILYLASDDSKFITGTEIIIDGGILAGSTAAPSNQELN